MSDQPMIVTCIALGTQHELKPNYPDDATEEQIREVNEGAKLWFQEYLRGEVHFLSEEALDKGFRFHSTLSLEEQPSFRFLRELGTDVLCRENRYFVNPADKNDHRMTDGLVVYVEPENQRQKLLAKENADQVKVPRITVDPE